MIDTEALRSKIMDLAIRGKLTEQLPEDGRAEDLYAKIQKEKAQLIKEGKIKKENALPEIMEDEIPFEIPKNWKWTRFGNLMKNRDFERVPVSVADRKKLKKIYDYYGASGVIDKVEDYLFDSKLLLIGEDGANLVSRSTPIAFMANGKYWVNNHAHVLDYYAEDYLDFVMYYINSISLIPYVTGSAQPKLNQDNMNRIPVPLPPIAEQKRIIGKVNDILGRIDEIENLQSQYAANIEILKSKLIDAAIRGKLTEQFPEDGNAEDLYNQIQDEKARLIKESKIKKEKPLPDISEDEIPFEIPKSWKWVRIGKVINEVIVPQRDKPSFSGNIPWCRIEDRDGIYLNGTKSGQYVSEETIREMNLRIFPVGTVLSACSGASIGTILVNTVECCTNQTFNGLVCNDLFYNWYLFWFLKSEINRLKSMGSGSAMAYISQDKIRNMLIPMPPIAEQKRIVEKLEAMMELL